MERRRGGEYFVVDHIGDDFNVVALLAPARLHVRVGVLVRAAEDAHLQGWQGGRTLAKRR